MSCYNTKDDGDGSEDAEDDSYDKLCNARVAIEVDGTSQARMHSDGVFLVAKRFCRKHWKSSRLLVTQVARSVREQLTADDIE